jgi:RNA polymerase sigma-70 factor (ECF subfamily)
VEQSPPESARFRRIYDGHVDGIRRYCYRRLPSADVDDATAEVFMVVWRRIDEVPEGDEAMLWMYGIARNVVRNQRRPARRVV